ncbi:hypothetical protein TrCOL_g13125 [Triparma columacea]|uniref:Rab-GAP TBC domain-containing protein n=1 Tax=Triparma columacea TaxID=722753 RepID=A0A9W7G6I1_9STRA|nr:hypothetical protein TrCOL_g13125 [Triparma columacea]
MQQGAEEQQNPLGRFEVLVLQMEDGQRKIVHDAYGFVKSAESRPMALAESTAERDRSWFTFLTRLGMDNLAGNIDTLKTNEGDKGNKDRQEFSRLVKLGIPVAFRQQIWLALASRSEKTIKLSSREFNANVSRARTELPSEVIKCIRNDLDRTFPGHSMFSSSSGLLNLECVLITFAFEHRSIRYCQGLNMYAGQFLQFLTPHDSLEMLRHFVTGILPETYFDNSMRGRMIDGLVIEHLIRDEMPTVHGKFEELDFDVAIATGAWFSQCFTGCFSDMELVFRVFDLLLWFGNIVVFRLAMSIVRKNEYRIIAAKSAKELYELFVKMALDVNTGDIREAAEYKLRTSAMEAMRDKIMGRKTDALEVEVERLRARYKAKVEEALGDDGGEDV